MLQRVMIWLAPGFCHSAARSLGLLFSPVLLVSSRFLILYRFPVLGLFLLPSVPPCLCGEGAFPSPLPSALRVLRDFVVKAPLLDFPPACGELPGHAIFHSARYTPCSGPGQPALKMTPLPSGSMKG